MIDFLSSYIIDRNWGGTNIMFFFFMFFTLVHFFSETEIDSKVLVAIAVAGFYMKYTLDDQKKYAKEIAIDRSKILDRNYKFVNQNMVLKKMIYSIRFLRKYNKRTFDTAVKHLDNFMYYINTISHKPFASSQVFDIAKAARIETLNHFSSLLLSMPSTPGHSGDNSMDILPYEKIMEIFIEDLRSITYTSLMRAGDLVNYEWKNNKNMYSGTADVDGETDTFIPSPVDPLNPIDSYHIH